MVGKTTLSGALVTNRFVQDFSNSCNSGGSGLGRSTIFRVIYLNGLYYLQASYCWNGSPAAYTTFANICTWSAPGGNLNSSSGGAMDEDNPWCQDNFTAWYNSYRITPLGITAAYSTAGGSATWPWR